MGGQVMRLGPLQAESWGDPEGFVTFGIPGLSANLRAFDVIAAAVAAPGRRFVSLDLRGRGLSEVTPPGSYGWESHARDVVAAADLLGAKRFNVVGWSMGAFVSLEVARQAGDRLDRVALIDAAGPVDEVVNRLVQLSVDRLDTVHPSLAAYLGLVKGIGTVTPWSEYWDRYFAYELQEVPGGVSSRSRKAAVMEDFDYGDRRDARMLWPALTMPVLLIRAGRPMLAGTGGDVVRPEIRDEFLAAVPRVEHVEIDANHYSIACHPETAEALRRFLS